MYRCRPGDGHRRTSWHPTVDLKVRRYAIEQRLLQMQKEDERFAELDARLDAIVSSSSTNSNRQLPTRDRPEMRSPCSMVVATVIEDGLALWVARLEAV